MLLANVLFETIQAQFGLFILPGLLYAEGLNNPDVGQADPDQIPSKEATCLRAVLPFTVDRYLQLKLLYVLPDAALLLFKLLELLLIVMGHFVDLLYSVDDVAFNELLVFFAHL